MTGSPPPDRRADALRRAEMAAAAQRSEADAARVLIADFVVRARERGIEPLPLLATQLNGRTVRTDRTGWYVNKKRSVAIGTDGAWYVLTVASARFGRLRPVVLAPTDPELVVGRGGRDGESGDLAEFLDRIITQGPIPPP